MVSEMGPSISHFEQGRGWCSGGGQDKYKITPPPCVLIEGGVSVVVVGKGNGK